MADSRTLKLSILADVDNLTKNLKKASVDTDNFGDKLTKFGSTALKAFAVASAAAAAYAIKIGVEGVKAAIEDEAAQAKLATTLRNATGATDAQIASTEKYLTVLALQTAKSDEELRPALERLALSTNNVGEAQKLLEVSTRVSVNSGIELGTVATAIAKAQDGNTTSLGKLGIGLSAAEVKGKSFAEILAMINKIYPDLGANTETAAFKMAQLKIGFEEAKESIGFALLPTLTSLINFLNISAIPAVNAFIDGLMGNYGMVDSLNSTEQGAFAVGASINTLSKSIAAMAIVFTSDGSTSLNGFIRILQFLADTANVVVTIIKELVSFIVEMANQVIGFLNLFGAGISKIKSIQGTAFASAWGTQSFATGGAPMAISGGGSFGPTSSSTSTILKMNSAIPTGSSSAKSLNTKAGQAAAFDKILSDTAAVMDLVDQAMGITKVDPFGYGTFRMGEAKSLQQYNITVNGAIDSESTARQIVEILNDSSARGTLGAGAFDR
jgi:hypothetical protein